MTDSLPRISQEEFTKQVQDALNRLYDLTYLQVHPLAQSLADVEAGSLQASRELRHILLQAIRSLRPQPGTPAVSADWRNYRVLEMRYLEGLSPAEIMDELSLSRSQYFRDQARVVEAVATHLWTQWQSALRQNPRGDAASAQKPQPEVVRESHRDALAHSEVERLRIEAQWQALDIVLLFDELRVVVDSLAHAKQVSTTFAFAHSLSSLRVDRVMLRQTLLNVITVALDVAAGGTLQVSTFQEQGEIGITLLARRPARETAMQTVMRQGVGLQVSEELMRAMGGELRMHRPADAHWMVTLAWPRQESPILLVVDDNEKFVQLCRRYLAALPWQVMGAHSGAEARRLIQSHRPTVILLDVMMPKEDGWDLLLALKADPATRDLPIVICSVLNEPEIAALLGASACLTKPFIQPALWQVLARWGPVDASQALAS